MSASTWTSWPELATGVASESLRVVSAHSRHFLALAVLFLLPLSLLLVSLPSLLSSLLHHHSSSSSPPQSLLRSSLPHHSPLFLCLLLAAVLLLLLLSAFSAVAGSVRSSFFGRPVKLVPALARVPRSLPRLVFTLLLLCLPLLLLSSPFALALRVCPSPFLLVPLSILSILVLLHFLISFSVALPVSALESASGLRPLRRSAHLVGGMRPVAISLYLFFVPGIVLVLWLCSLGEVGGFANWREAAPVIARTVFGLALTVLLLLYWMVSGVVMYLYCKAVHGELAAEIAEEFAWEYVCLPFDLEKVPHVVSVVHQ